MVTNSPIRLILALVGSIFAGELLLMGVFALLPLPSPWIEAFLDATLLSIFSAPILYFLVFRPITAHVSELKNAGEALRLAQYSLDHTQDAIFRMNREARIIYVNEAACHHLGYSRDELLELSIPDIDPDYSREVWDNHWEDVTNAGHRQFETRHKRKDGTIVPVEIITSSVIFDKDHFFFASVRNIAERKRSEQKIHSLAFYDTLTGLANRRLLLDRLSLALSVSARNQQYGALLFLDLDNFKTLNDTLGHGYGDMLLIEVAHRLKSCVREVDTVARFGGDEFVLLLEEVSAEAKEASQNVAIVAEKICTTLAAPYQLRGNVHHSSASIGVCLFFGNDESVDVLIKRADTAMYQAKKSGRNRVQFIQLAA